ncbi:hypothetical protein B7486_25520 [cyanobacterium TDX16]|nr:hypothetical protein B7486_25520 [cyanobacterium TDX16]
MLSEITLNPTLSEQTSECHISECLIERTEIDCYPYATRGILFGILFGSLFWGAIAGAFMLLL